MFVRLPEGAYLAKQSYGTIYRKLLDGSIRGRRSGTRWEVDADDCRRLAAESARGRE